MCIGSNIARAIATANNPTRMVQISSRRPEKIYRSLYDSLPEASRKQLLPPKAADVTDPTTLARAFQGADVVVSLVGIMHGTPADFERIQWRGAEHVAIYAREAGAKLIHISAIGADVQSEVPYERTKALGEQAVLKACPDATIIRPSLVFGPEDDFFNRFAKLSRIMPFMPVFGGGTALFQPVYVGDIARAVEVLSRNDPDIMKEVSGKIIEAGGPDVVTYRQIMELVLRYSKRWRPIVSIPFGIGLLQASVLEKLPPNIFTLTQDQVRQLKKSNVVNATDSDIPFAKPVATLGHGSIKKQDDQGDQHTLVPSSSDMEAQSPAVDDVPEKPYSVFSTKEKWAIVVVSSFAGLFSPLTANSYFPAIPIIAAEFHKSTELINLTVTAYMIFQGLSPMVWGPLSDRWGRRLMFIACLLLLAISCVGVALTPTSDYWLLMVMRCVQSSGSASTVAIGAGVIADIATISERGSFFGLYSIGPMIGPAIGPVIGGGLTQSLGWRSIFWFLCISSATCAMIMALVFPETLRAIVGDGSIPPPRISRPIIPIIGRNRISSDKVEKPPRKPFINPLRLFFYPEVTLLLIFNGVVYAVFYGVTASISTLFKVVYPFLNETDIGLCFLAIGGGMLIGTVAHGKVLDREYRVVKAKLIKEGSLSVEDSRNDETFPIEYARFRTMPIWLGLFTICCIGYGWALEQRVNIAVPLVMQIIMGYMIICVMNTTQTLIIDMLPAQGSSITACNNFARCSLGAGMVSVINVIINSVGIGWTYVILGALCLAVSPIMFIVMRMGPKWRAARRARKAAAEKFIDEKSG
ncbi:hypothetical protein EUX98_g1068 [Antrodiella citrinella]|uniref:Major facilitator superfamily (MFS) profile domain-containing protein n=1 Tax=Antrodiella citrinella TaxID=2447956 RepID=A0A4V3XJI1_9APHY|nr:hypothetical protein EUX98_g1068 [Antrodiella citrinella]